MQNILSIEVFFNTNSIPEALLYDRQAREKLTEHKMAELRGQFNNPGLIFTGVNHASCCVNIQGPHEMIAEITDYLRQHPEIGEVDYGMDNPKALRGSEKPAKDGFRLG